MTHILMTHSSFIGLRKHDVCFLVTLQPTKEYGHRYNYKEAFLPQTGLVCVRGCEIEGLLDVDGKVIDDFSGFFKILIF